MGESKPPLSSGPAAAIASGTTDKQSVFRAGGRTTESATGRTGYFQDNPGNLYQRQSFERRFASATVAPDTSPGEPPAVEGHTRAYGEAGARPPLMRPERSERVVRLEVFSFPWRHMYDLIKGQGWRSGSTAGTKFLFVRSYHCRHRGGQFSGSNTPLLVSCHLWLDHVLRWLRRGVMEPPCCYIYKLRRVEKLCTSAFSVSLNAIYPLNKSIWTHRRGHTDRGGRGATVLEEGSGQQRLPRSTTDPVHR